MICGRGHGKKTREATFQALKAHETPDRVTWPCYLTVLLDHAMDAHMAIGVGGDEIRVI